MSLNISTNRQRVISHLMISLADNGSLLAWFNTGADNIIIYGTLFHYKMILKCALIVSKGDWGDERFYKPKADLIGK